MKPLGMLWERQVAVLGSGTMNFSDFSFIVKSAEPSVPTPTLRALYLTSVEASRACTQIYGAHCPVVGTLEEVGQTYGGDLVTFKLLFFVALRCGLYIKETQPGHGEAHNHAQHNGA